ncbi:MAG: hypothetical protein AAFZ15_06700 [Bacteroidota bacterium]
MGKWSNNSLREVLTEALPEFGGQSPFKIIFGGIHTFILSAFFYYPVIFIQVILLFRKFSLLNCIAFLLILIIFFTFYRATKEAGSLKVLKDLSEYLTTLREEFKIKKYQIEDYVSEKLNDELRVARQFSMINNEKIGYVYVIKPILEKEVAQRKGFTIPITYKKLGQYRKSNLKALSAIFIRDIPGDVAESTSGTFQLLHEIGHMTKYSDDIKNRSALGYLNLITVIGLLLLNNHGINYSWLWFLPFFLYIALIESNKTINEQEDELVADTFAIKKLPEDKLTRFKKLIPKLKGINEERRNNIYINIEKRSKNIFFSEDAIIFRNKNIRFFTSLMIVIGSFYIPIKDVWPNILILFSAYILSQVYLFKISRSLITTTNEVELSLSELEE